MEQISKNHSAHFAITGLPKMTFRKKNKVNLRLFLITTISIYNNYKAVNLPEISRNYERNRNVNNSAI